MNTFKQRFQKDHLIKSFLVCAFPIHLWTIILFFRDIGWIADRTNMGDALGVGAYAMVFALIESLFYLIPITTLNILIPWRQPQQKALAITSYIALIIPFWVGIGQIIQYNYHNVLNQDQIIDALIDSGHPVRYFILVYLIFLSILLGSILLPVYFINFKDRPQYIMISVIERIEILTYLYIFLDLIGLISIIFRNMSL